MINNMSTSTTWNFNGGLNRKQERHIKSRIKKVFGEKISETFLQDFNGNILISLNDDSSNLFGDTIIGSDYESALKYLNDKLYQLRQEKINRLMK